MLEKFKTEIEDIENNYGETLSINITVVLLNLYSFDHNYK